LIRFHAEFSPGILLLHAYEKVIELPSSKQNSKTPCPPIDKEGKRVASVDFASESFRVGKEKLNNNVSQIFRLGFTGRIGDCLDDFFP